MMIKSKDSKNEVFRYINIKLLKTALYLLSIVSFIYLLVANYDIEYKWVVIQPITFFISTGLFVRENGYENGLGKIALIIAYAFRMCLLPMICAYGNFWLEPSKAIYVPYFSIAVFLTIFENVFVFACMSHYSKKYSNNVERRECGEYNNSFIVIIIFLVAIVMVALFAKSGMKNYYHFIFASNVNEIEKTGLQASEFGTYYYVIMLLDILFRPLFSFYFINKLLKKRGSVRIALAVTIAILNALIMTDRRVLSLIIAIVCLMEIVFILRSEKLKMFIYISIVVLAIGVIVFAFSMYELSPQMIARKFQRYFSGTSLVAIGLNVLFNKTPHVTDFCALLFNDSIILTGLFGNLEVREYVVEVCGSAGKSIWTPMIIGLFQYFKVFAPVILAFFVKYIVKNDHLANTNTLLWKMIFDYLSVSVSIYIVMYSAELIVYNILFIGGFFRLLLYISKRETLKIRQRIII